MIHHSSNSNIRSSKSGEEEEEEGEIIRRQEGSIGVAAAATTTTTTTTTPSTTGHHQPLKREEEPLKQAPSRWGDNLKRWGATGGKDWTATTIKALNNEWGVSTAPYSYGLPPPPFQQQPLIPPPIYTTAIGSTLSRPSPVGFRPPEQNLPSTKQQQVSANIPTTPLTATGPAPYQTIITNKYVSANTNNSAVVDVSTDKHNIATAVEYTVLSLTCASLGADSKIIKRAENAVLKLSKLVALQQQQPQDTLLLPTKDQILRGIADIDIQIKQLNDKKHVLSTTTAEQDEEDKKKNAALQLLKQQQEEEEKKKKIAAIELLKQQEEEEKKKKKIAALELLKQQEEDGKKKKKLQQELDELLLKKKHYFEKKEVIHSMETEVDVEWRPRIEKKLKMLRKMKESLQIGQAHLTTATNDLNSVILCTKRQQQQESINKVVENDNNMTEILSNIVEENRRLAQQAHWNSISTCLPLPNDEANNNNTIVSNNNNNNSNGITPIVQLNNTTTTFEATSSDDNNNKIAVINDDDDEDDDVLKPVTNDQWTALTRRIMSPVDALYTDPMESLYWNYHEQIHNQISKDFIFDSIRKKKHAMQKYWEELSTDYLAYQTLWNTNKNRDASTCTASCDIVNEDDYFLGDTTPTSNNNEQQQERSNNKRTSSATANTHITTALHASYRRNRRPLRGSTTGSTNSSSNTFIRGLGDVVRSEYEQELIIKELTEKEAMEKRIKHGGCSLPRQVTSFERELFVSYQVDFTPRRVFDMLEDERDMKHISPWTDMEKCVFFDRFLLFPKDFKKIASFLRNKTTMDCVAFYYDAKKSLPFKAALREHILRKKMRGRASAENNNYNNNVSWTATVQAAISAGAIVSEGDGSDEKPFTFSIPQGDNTYITSKFHPMQRDILDLSRMDSSEYSVVVKDNDNSNNGFSFTLDDPNLTTISSPAAAATASDIGGTSENNNDDTTSTYVGIKRRLSSQGKSREETTDHKIIRSPIAKCVHESKVIDEAEETTSDAAQVLPVLVVEDFRLSSSSLGSRKMPQKWAPKEKKIFFETMQQYGKDWPALVAAVGNKTLQQVKNFYYDSNKKQATKQQQHTSRSSSLQGPDDHTSLKDSSVTPPEAEESSNEFSRVKQEGESFIQPSVDVAAESRIHANTVQHVAGLHAHMMRENQLGPAAGIGTVSGLQHGQYPVIDRVGQNAHHDFLSNLNMNPWAAAAAQQLMQQSRDPCLRIREAWALEASIRQQQQQFQQMAYTLGGQPPSAAHYPRDILSHIRASAGYSTSPVPFVNASPSDAQAALVALSQMSAARNLVAQRMASRSGESSTIPRAPDQRSNPANSYNGQFKRDSEYGNDSSSQ